AHLPVAHVPAAPAPRFATPRRPPGAVPPSAAVVATGRGGERSRHLVAAASGAGTARGSRGALRRAPERAGGCGRGRLAEDRRRRVLRPRRVPAPGARAGAAAPRRARGAARPLPAGERQRARPDHALDAHREAGAGGCLSHLPADAPPRALPPPRLHLSASPGLAAHAGILPARIQSLRGVGRRGERSPGAPPTRLTRAGGTC